MTFRAAILAAVSRPEQATDDKESIPTQLRECREACERAGWPVVAETIIPGHSRDYAWLHQIIADCPEYAELVHLIEGETVNLLVVRHYDRLWRTDGLRSDVMRLCREHGVQVYSTSQPRAPVPPDQLKRRAGLSSIMETLSGAISEEEQQIRVARLRAGMHGRLKAGRPHVGPNVPYGYRRNDKGDLEQVPEEVYWLRWAAGLLREGHGVSAIASDFTRMQVPPPGANRPTIASGTVWHPRSLKRILINPLYGGGLHWGSLHEWPAHLAYEPVFSREEWEEIQQRLGTLQRHTYQHVYTDNWLRGILRCGICHRSMAYYRAIRTSPRLYLRCSLYVETHGAKCVCNGHSATVVHQYVLDTLYRMLGEEATWRNARDTQRDDAGTRLLLEQAEKAQGENRARHERWSQAFEVGAIGLAELVEHRNRLDSESVELERRVRELRAQLLDNDAVFTRYADLRAQRDYLPYAPDEVKRTVAHGLLQCVELKRGEEPRFVWW